jgi:hypothetical protein
VVEAFPWAFSLSKRRIKISHAGSRKASASMALETAKRWVGVKLVLMLFVLALRPEDQAGFVSGFPSGWVAGEGCEPTTRKTH